MSQIDKPKRDEPRLNEYQCSVFLDVIQFRSKSRRLNGSLRANELEL